MLYSTISIYFCNTHWRKNNTKLQPSYILLFLATTLEFVHICTMYLISILLLFAHSRCITFLQCVVLFMILWSIVLVCLILWSNTYTNIEMSVKCWNHIGNRIVFIIYVMCIAVRLLFI